MLVANSFDLWRKDAFFSAAEEVQESADMYASSLQTLFTFLLNFGIELILATFASMVLFCENNY